MQASWLSQVSKHGGLAGGFNDVVRGHMRTSLLANSLQAPRVVPNTASQMSSFGEEAQRSAQPSPKHAGAGVDSHLSLRVPAMQQNQPVVGHGVGFGHLLPVGRSGCWYWMDGLSALKWYNQSFWRIC
jgi:hypothetical protein